jgi:beta-N-acetylhexosaminidase
MSGGRFVVGLEGASLTAREEKAFATTLPFGFLLLPRNLVTPGQTIDLISRLKTLGEPAPLVFVDQEGGRVDRLGPLLGQGFPSAEAAAQAGSDRVHEAAFLMGSACRLLGFDADFAPCVDLGQPEAGAVILEGRTFGFHAEDVVVAGMVFLHGLARAGIASCLKHFPGLGRGKADSHESLTVIDAHDVDLIVTDLVPFTRLARVADSVMVSHAAYPELTGSESSASLSPGVFTLLRKQTGFDRLAFSDDLNMGALSGPVAERAMNSAAAGCDVLVVSRPGAEWEEMVARVGEVSATSDPDREKRVRDFRDRCLSSPRRAFSEDSWERLRSEVFRFTEALKAPRVRRTDEA